MPTVEARGTNYCILLGCTLWYRLMRLGRFLG
jgi:hypothetical protein